MMFTKKIIIDKCICNLCDKDYDKVTLISNGLDIKIKLCENCLSVFQRFLDKGLYVLSDRSIY